MKRASTQDKQHNKNDIAARANNITTVLLICALILVVVIAVVFVINAADTASKNPAGLLPVFGAMFSAFLLCILVGGVLTQRLAVAPIKRMTHSIQEAHSSNGDIYGHDRNDEIGNLSRTIKEILDRLNSYNENLLRVSLEQERQEQLLHAVNDAATVLLGAVDEEKFESSLKSGMELMALCVDVDRIIIWRNEIRDGDLYYVKQQEYISSIGRQLNPGTPSAAYSYDKESPEWLNKFSKREYVNSPVTSLSANEQRFLVSHGTKSFLAIPVYLQENFWGFVGFDDCRNERAFTEEEVRLLRSASLMIVNAVERNAQEAKIHEAHERTKIMIDATPLCCNLWDRNLNAFECNSEAVKLFKLKNKQEYLNRFFELSPEYQPDGQPSYEKATAYIKKAFKDGGCSFEWMHQMLDGTPVPSEITLVRVSYGGDYVVAGYTRDMREHNQMIKEIEYRGSLLNTVNRVASVLLQSETDEFENDLQKCMGMIAKAVDADRVHIWKNHIVDSHLYCTQLYEWSENVEPQQNNKYTMNISYSDNLPEWEKILSNGYCINGLVNDMSPDVQAQLFPQDILSILVVPVFLHNEFWGFVGFDDCHRGRVFSENEESILRSGSILIANSLLRNDMTSSISATAAKLEAVIANYSGIIWNVDKNNIITLFNGLYLNELGLTPAFMEGKSLGIALQKGRHLDIFANVQKTFDEGPQDWISEIDGKVFRAHTTPIFDDNGNVSNVVGSIDDISELLRLQSELETALEKAQAASHAKSNFLSNMSHEIRTPMNAIIGMTNIGKSATDLERKDYAFEKIEGASAHLLGIINDILDMSKIEAGKFELSLEDFDFEKMLKKVVNVISFRVEEKRQRFSVYLDKNIPRNLIGDDQRLTQVIANLLSNAVKFTPEENSIRLEAHLLKEENGICTIKVVVTDTGIGISTEQQVRLFTSFEQAESNTSRKFGGTGLGLAISKHIVELMDGSIWIESELGVGSTFSFTIQLERSTQQALRPISSGLELSCIRLLVVDDEAETLDYFSNIAEQLGIACDTAAGGVEALECIDNNGSYDICFVDWKMPDMDGIELSRKILERGSDETIVVLISASEWNIIEQSAKAVGVSRFLPKPLFPSDVADCINKCLATADAPAAGAKRDEIVSFEGHHILLAEDVEINREIVLAMLEDMQIEIDCAVNGIEAVKIFSEAPDKYDLIFMDIQMPEMDGLEATRRIRAIDTQKAKEIPIIAMTANVFREDIEKCLDAGMNEHVGKPLDFDEVLEKLKSYLT